MSKWDIEDHYYSGQGVVMTGLRDALGRPAGLLPIGNVPSLKLSVATSSLEHKESHTGARGTDLRLRTEVKVTAAIEIENFISRNLALSMSGTHTTVAASTTTAEAVKGYLGKVMPVNRIQVSSFVLKRGATTLTQYTNDSTPYDYKVNEDAGSFQLNDGLTVLSAALTTGGTVPSAITVGNPTVVTVANTAVVGDYVMFSGFAGANAATLNKKAFKITVASPTSVSIDVDTTALTITIGTPLSFFDGGALTADYSFAGQNLVDTLTEAAVDLYMRFEGLNTVDNDSPVIVEIFKFSSDPLKELDLIGDGLQKFTLEGSVLLDALQTTGSQYYKVTQLN